MPRKPVTNRACPNPDCASHAQFGKGNIVRHSFIRLRRGRRRRYRCKTCGRTFCSSTATPYHRLHYSPSTFDQVIHMSVEGVSKAAIARIESLPRCQVLPDWAPGGSMPSRWIHANNSW
jgi:transposase-like protein